MELLVSFVIHVESKNVEYLEVKSTKVTKWYWLYIMIVVYEGELHNFFW